MESAFIAVGLEDGGAGGPCDCQPLSLIVELTVRSHGVLTEMTPAQQQQTQMAVQPMATARSQHGQPIVPSGLAVEDKMSKVKELKQMLDSGALTQAEFDAEKKKVLRAIRDMFRAEPGCKGQEVRIKEEAETLQVSFVVDVVERLEVGEECRRRRSRCQSLAKDTPFGLCYAPDGQFRQRSLACWSRVFVLVPVLL